MMIRAALVCFGLLILLFVIAWVRRVPSQSSPEPLHDAAYNGDLKKVKTLLVAGADVNARSKLGETVSDLENVSARLVQENADGSVVYQLESKQHVVTVDLFGRTVYDTGVRLWSRGSTPLQVALEGGQNEVASYLLTVGAAVNVKNEFGITPLLDAVYTASPEVVKKLLASGADVDAKDEEGNTPLHGAVQNNRAEIVKLLLAAGADATARNKEGESPIDLCRYLGHDRIAEMLDQNISGSESSEESEK